MKQVFLNRQRGLTLMGLIVILIVLGFFGILGAQVVPTYMEYRAISKAIVTAKAAGSVAEIKQSFNKQIEVNYISSIKAEELEISKVNGVFEISFEYEKKIPLIGPASLLMEYQGTTAPSSGNKQREIKE
jgi:Tfp pilus assembly protein PilE